MKILKILLLIAIILTLYITEPVWRQQTNAGTAEAPQINAQTRNQQEEKKHLTAEEAKKLMKLEAEFGKKPSVAYKSRVPDPVQEYWDKTHGEYAVYEDICTPLQSSAQGWTTSCQYKVKSGKGTGTLSLDTYIIKNGKIVK